MVRAGVVLGDFNKVFSGFKGRDDDVVVVVAVKGDGDGVGDDGKGLRGGAKDEGLGDGAKGGGG